MTDQDPIITKIQKLQSLADSAVNEHEAALAAQRIAELCERHNLDIGVARLQEEETRASDSTFILGAKRSAHINYLAFCIRKLFDVGTYQTMRYLPVTNKAGVVTGSKRQACEIIYGLKANVQSAIITLEYLQASIEAMLKGWILEGNDGRETNRRSFRIGCANRISNEVKKITAVKPQIAGSESQALVVLSNQLIKQYGVANGLKTVSRPIGAVRPDAYSAGYSAGGRIDIHGARSSRMLN